MTDREAKRRVQKMSQAARRDLMIAAGFNPGVVRQMSQGPHFTCYVSLALFFSRADRNYWIASRNRQWAREQNAS